MSFEGNSHFEYYYNDVSSNAVQDIDHEAPGRFYPKRQVYGQGAFFNLVNKLHIPIIGRTENSVLGQDHIHIGQGGSYSVTRPVASHTIPPTELANGSQPSVNKQKLLGKRVVTKRLVPSRSHAISDARHLAAITNEVRILGNETVKTTEYLVKLLAVAWDETPDFNDRYWPRLVLEAADYGNLAQFLATNDESKKWKVKTNLILDILSGLKILHNHNVAHCDLKLENVLIFQRSKKMPFECDFQAKLCDFGFSVIISDFENDAKLPISGIAGTEPWTAPELSSGTEVSVFDLIKADIYSFSLLCSRVFLEGSSPFARLTAENIQALKQPGAGDDDDLKMYEYVTSAIFEHVEYAENQQLAIKKLLVTTLLPNPKHRFEIAHFASEFLLLGYLFDE